MTQDEYEKTEEFKKALLIVYTLTKLNVTSKTKQGESAEYHIKTLTRLEETYPCLLAEHKNLSAYLLLPQELHYLIED